jgi:Bifunctional DNA primase/polymerase, N-terminal
MPCVPGFAAGHESVGLDWLAGNINKLPPTRVQVTRSGGKHLFFHHVDGVRCSAGRIAVGVDVRGDGGYIIDWSREGYPCEERAIAGWPDWLLRLALHPSGPWGSNAIGPHRDGQLLHGPSVFACPDNQLTANNQPTATRDLRMRSKSILRKIEYTRPGRRNELLNWGSYQFGLMIAEGRINPDIASLLLEGAAKVCGLWRDDGPSQCKATIRSGINAGIRDWNEKERAHD